MPLECGKPRVVPRASRRPTVAATDSCSRSDRPFHQTSNSSVNSTSQAIAPPSAGNRIIAPKEYSIKGMFLLLESSEDCLRGSRYNFRCEWMAGTAALGIWRSELRELDIRERIREELLFEVYSKWIDKIANQRGGDKMRRLAARHLPERPIRPSEPESEQPRQAQCGPKPFLVLELVARPTGIEPVSRASETLILSIELRAQRKEAVLYPVFAELHELDQIFRQTQRKPRRLHWTRVYDTVI